MRPLLAILICHLPERAKSLSSLLDQLDRQMQPGVRICIRSEDRGVITTGQKRNLLLDDAGDAAYVVHVDDDDQLHPAYLSSILKAIDSRPDVVGYKVRRFVEGKQIGEAIHSIRYKRSQTVAFGDWIRYERVPNHLNPVRTDLAREVRFKDITYGEDHDYANRLRPLLKTEKFIDQYLYDYYLIVKKAKPYSELCQLNLTSQN